MDKSRSNSKQKVETKQVDLDTGEILDVTTGQSFKAAPFPEFIQQIISAGGLVEAVKKGLVR